MVSTLRCISSELILTLMSDLYRIPDVAISASYMGAGRRSGQTSRWAVRREKGRPEPPPVLSPMMVTLGSIFILFTKSLVALKERRLVSTTACFASVHGLVTVPAKLLWEWRSIVPRSGFMGHIAYQHFFIRETCG